jgi:WD40 repeat protein
LKVWDVTTGQEALTLKGYMTPVYGVCFSPDGKRLASASRALESGSEFQRFSTHLVSVAAIHSCRLKPSNHNLDC